MFFLSDCTGREDSSIPQEVQVREKGFFLLQVIRKKESKKTHIKTNNDNRNTLKKYATTTTSLLVSPSVNLSLRLSPSRECGESVWGQYLGPCAVQVQDTYIDIHT